MFDILLVEIVRVSIRPFKLTLRDDYQFMVRFKSCKVVEVILELVRP